MSDHMNLSDSELIIQFKSYHLSPALFTHEVHLRIAWLYLTIYGLDKGIYTIRRDLKSYVHNLGAADKYHETLTIAASHAVHHFMQKSKAATFEEFISQNTRLMTHFDELINSHYSRNIFTDQEARSRYFEPDLLPFEYT
jgi:hypothetical protein